MIKYYTAVGALVTEKPLSFTLVIWVVIPSRMTVYVLPIVMVTNILSLQYLVSIKPLLAFALQTILPVQSLIVSILRSPVIFCFFHYAVIIIKSKSKCVEGKVYFCKSEKALEFYRIQATKKPDMKIEYLYSKSFMPCHLVVFHCAAIGGIPHCLVLINPQLPVRTG